MPGVMPLECTAVQPSTPTVDESCSTESGQPFPITTRVHDDGFIVCTRCRVFKHPETFHKSKTSSTGRHCYCKPCGVIVKNEWYHKNKSEVNARLCIKRGCKTHAAALAEKNRKWRNDVRVKVLKHYSFYNEIHCCSCGVTNLDIMVLDHTRDDGNKHRGEIGKNTNIYIWLNKNGLPEGFQVMCHNCNWFKHITKKVPHYCYIDNFIPTVRSAHEQLDEG